MPVKVRLRLEDVLRDARRFLQSQRVPEASASAEFLVSHLVGFKRLELYVKGDQLVPADTTARLEKLLKRRAEREPLSYLLGTQEFFGMKMKVTPDVLIPRPETELLVRRAIYWIRLMEARSVADLGTGSGCIAICLARSFPHLKVYATDISLKALRVAKMNGRDNKVLGQVRYVQADLFKPAPASGLRSFPQLDMIVSNPPYVAREELSGLAPEIHREPRVALDGGERGLEVIRRIVQQAPAHLKPGGMLLLEIGDDQGPEVRRLMLEAGLSDVSIEKDLDHLDRVAVARKAA